MSSFFSAAAGGWACAVSWTCLIPASMLTRPLIASTCDESWALSCCSDFRPDRISPNRAETSGFEDMAGDCETKEGKWQSCGKLRKLWKQTDL